MATHERVLDVAVITRKSQVTVTKPVRELLGLKEGDRILFILKDGEVVLRKA
jgi:AbrB family looped-hinge helix DNA binding protein